MKTYLVAVLALQSFHVAFTCSGALPLPDLERRARNYQANGLIGSDPFIDDQLLISGWYNLGKHKMPDKTTKPSYTFCGGVQPIYIRETHPVVSEMNQTSILVTVCEHYGFDDCLDTLNILIRKCGDDLQYYLGQTGHRSAYCFDPPHIQDVPDFADPPTGYQFGTLKVTVYLRFNISGGQRLPYNEYKCEENPEYDRTNLGLLYSTYWFANDSLHVAFERLEKVTHITDKDLQTRNEKYLFNVHIRCGVRISKTQTGLQTLMVSSDDFFVGVKVLNPVILLDKNGTAKIFIQPTIPFGCYLQVGTNSSGNCYTSVRMFFPELDHCKLDSTNTGDNLHIVTTAKQQMCGAQIFGYYPDQISNGFPMKTVSMTITSPFYSKSDKNRYTVPLMIANSGTHYIWKGQVLQPVQVTVKESELVDNICYSRVDPHMKYSDNCERISAYENNDRAGEFILYRNIEYNIEVQERTTSCNNNNAFCTCAVAVRAGGDVFLINYCGGLRFRSMTSCKDGGKLVIQEISASSFEIQTNIGTLIKIKVHSGSFAYLMDVAIHMAPKDLYKTRGLCGIFDNVCGNDFHDRDGNKVYDEKTFVNHWRLTANDINFLKPSCDVNVTNWEDDVGQLYCLCSCLNNNCSDIQAQSVCSPTQYINCTVKHDATPELCSWHIRECKKSIQRKRSSFFVDPEIEMKRRASLANKHNSKPFKRQSENEISISEESANNLCSEAIHSPGASKFTDLLSGVNISQLVKECTFDVFVGQDTGWVDPAVSTVNDAIKTGFKRDANYTLSHMDELEEFQTQSCPLNCSDHGVCNKEGVCDCDSSWFGPECGYNIREGPFIEDVEADGFCDQRFDSECKCFFFQTTFLAKNFTCRRLIRKRYSNGAFEDIKIESVKGDYNNIYNGECCFDEGRSKRSTDDESNNSNVLMYEFEVAVSNDGLNYGPNATLYVYDSTCLNVTKQETGNTVFELKANTCQINGLCYEENGNSLADICYKCKPGVSQHNFTFDCTSDETRMEDGNKSKMTIIVVTTVCVGFILVLALVIGWFVHKKVYKPKRCVSDQFSSGTAVSSATFNERNTQK